MTEDDEKRLRLGAARRNVNDGYGLTHDEAVFLLRLLDTERAERARVEEELGRAQGVSDTEIALLDRATQAESALAAAREVLREMLRHGWFDESGDKQLVARARAALTPETP